MEPYGWVKALERFAHNAREALTHILGIVDVFEMLLVRAVIFAGFVYGAYSFVHGH